MGWVIHCESVKWAWVTVWIKLIRSLIQIVESCWQAVCTHTHDQVQDTHTHTDLHEICSGRHVSSHVSRQHRVKRGPRGVVSGCHVKENQYTHIQFSVYNHSLCIVHENKTSTNIIPSPRHSSPEQYQKCTDFLSLLWVCQVLCEYDSEIFDSWQIVTWRLSGAQTTHHWPTASETVLQSNFPLAALQALNQHCYHFQNFIFKLIYIRNILAKPSNYYMLSAPELV